MTWTPFMSINTLRIKAELKWCAPVMSLYRPADLSREEDTNVDNGVLFKGAEASSFD